MTDSFDTREFDYRHGRILGLPSSATIVERNVQIEELAHDFAQVSDKIARRYIDSAIEYLILIALIDTDQPFEPVSEQYNKCLVSQLFSPWRNVYATIFFAQFCHEQGKTSEGIGALEDAKRRLALSPIGPVLSPELKVQLEGELDSHQTRLKTE